jgi:formylglycine-generating enzyme
MTRQECATNGAAWSAHCSQVGCPMLVCESLDPIACHNGMCQGEQGTGGATGSGGTSSTAGSSGAGGTTAAAGTTADGGTTAAAGATGSAGTAGVGCRGSFEAVETINAHDLCLAKMVTIPGETGGAGNTDYQIDATEVTQGQYRSWLMTNPVLPTSLDLPCGWKSTWSDPDLGTTSNSDADHRPIAAVDWCDAYWYCATIGKRLCGKIGGGPNDDPAGANAVGIDQWYTACSSNGAYGELGYPYGQTYSPTACNGVDAAKGETVGVTTMTSCHSSLPDYAGIFDLSGNVSEWEDSCDGRPGNLGGCRIRGGDFNNYGFPDATWAGQWLTCGVGVAINRDVTGADVGFRCCSR